MVKYAALIQTGLLQEAMIRKARCATQTVKEKKKKLIKKNKVTKIVSINLSRKGHCEGQKKISM